MRILLNNVVVVIAICLAMLVSHTASADALVEIVSLTPETARKLGFEISIAEDGGAIITTMLGPNIFPNNCPPTRSGAALLDADDTEIMVFVSDLHSGQDRPRSIGYFFDKTKKMVVWLDYLCPESRLREGRRYSIDSVLSYMRAIPGRN